MFYRIHLPSGGSCASEEKASDSAPSGIEILSSSEIFVKKKIYQKALLCEVHFGDVILEAELGTFRMRP